jgi:hypothetical protein
MQNQQNCAGLEGSNTGDEEAIAKMFHTTPLTIAQLGFRSNSPVTHLGSNPKQVEASWSNFENIVRVDQSSPKSLAGLPNQIILVA